MRLLPFVLLATSHLADADCASSELVPAVFTRRDTRLPADGGVLVGFAFTTDLGQVEGRGDPSDVKWTAHDANKVIALTRTALAPGLAVLRPADSVLAFTLTNSHGKDLGSFTHEARHEAARAQLAAPEPKSVKIVPGDPTSSHYAGTVTPTLVVAAAPPPGAVAIIMYNADLATPKPINFTQLADTHDKDTTFEVYRPNTNCGAGAPSDGAVIKGAKLTFAYVDAFGRLSPQSKPIRAIDAGTKNRP